MAIPSDYKELLSVLNRLKARYLIVGAYAVIYYTEPRYTKDIDIWVEPEIENAKKVYRALKKFGAPLKDVSPEDFVKKNMIYQIGVAPVRADILMGIGDIEFNQAWAHRRVVEFEGIKVNIIGLKDLIMAKKRAKRQSDAIDIDNLQQGLKLIKKR
jgi:predicted nucleotidyltransferase